MAFWRFPKGFKSPRETHRSPTKHFFLNLRPGKTHIGPRNNSKQLLDGAAILIFFRLPANHISNIHTYVPPYVRTDIPKKNRDVPTNESFPSRKSDGRKWPSRCCLTPTNPARPKKQVSRVYVCKKKSCSIKVATPSNFRLKNFFRYVQPRLCWVICRVWGYQPRQRGS